MGDLIKITIVNYTTAKGKFYKELPLSYQAFGLPLGTAPVVLVNHALTGNSNIAGKTGWWKTIVGNEKVVNTLKYTVLAFNIPGNGFDGVLFENYKDFIAKDVAELFLLGLKTLKIPQLFAIIGGSLGGGIAWEMCAIQPKITQHLIPIATDWKSTDWLIANCQIQEQLLNNSNNPVHDARMHAMLCYRTPKSFKNRFQRTYNAEQNVFNVESWLLHHGKKLQERFQLSAYKLMNQLLKSINVDESLLQTIQAKIHIIGVDSDLFFTADENRETAQSLAQKQNNITYNEIHSDHGHDAFLMEYDQLETILTPIFHPNQSKKMKVIKFGGQSLANGNGLQTVLTIIRQKVEAEEPIVVVVSARGKSTDLLEKILEKSATGENTQEEFEEFKDYQSEGVSANFSTEFARLQNLFDGVKLLGDYSLKIKDEVLAHGELISAKTITHLLKEKGVSAKAVDARRLIVTDNEFGNAQPNLSLSREKTLNYFDKIEKNEVQIITGFIASNAQGETTTLGRNGSNYTAALIANFIDADELQNFTHVNGIYTANPDLVPNAKKIEQLSFEEANELANFGASILHAKTILPLIEKNIDLRILNTFNASDNGTLITANAPETGIRSLSVLKNVSLIHFEGRGLLGKVGIDARVFSALSRENISVSIISQGSSERGLGFVVPTERAKDAIRVLKYEFERDIATNDVQQISVENEVAVISIIGQQISEFHLPFNALIQNNIVPILFNNALTGKNVSLVVKEQQLNKALNVIHGQIFQIAKTINIAVFGIGLVGGTLLNQLLENVASILEKRKVKLNIFAISNSKTVLLCSTGIEKNWRAELLASGQENYTIQDVIAYAEEHHLENLIAVDNTASKEFVQNYIPLVQAGFDLVSSNKTANTLSYNFYQELRKQLEQNKRKYLYETTVGAGLPLIDTIRLLHESGENITRIRGVFSGSLSYIFNTFSTDDVPFSSVLKNAMEKGYTEPDPREDLNGNDVARKLLILARELELENEFEEIQIENLIPENLQNGDTQSFLENLSQLDDQYQRIKINQKEGNVLRYIGDLAGDLSKNKGNLSVKLVSVPLNSSLGSLKGSDAIIEIFTESYGDQPIVIQGAGAGAKVTARGVFGDILRLS